MGLLLIALLCSLVEVKSIECSVACKFDNYDGGYYLKGECLCVDRHLHKDMVEKRKKVGIRKLSESADEL